MVSRMSDRKVATHVPGDLLSLFFGAAVLIVYAVVPFRYSWLVFLLFGVMGLWLAASVLKHRPTSPSAWLNAAMGIAGVVAAVYFFLALRTI
jgi:hypothetical protein